MHDDDTQGDIIRLGSARKTGFLKRWLWRLVLVIVLFALLPYLLLPLYRPTFVHPISVPMFSRLVTVSGYDRQWVAFEDISPVLVQSVMMSEDGQFCNHHGVDWRELQAVAQDAFSGERARGASTIPMQTVKNLFLWNDRSYIRKVAELPLAIAADIVWPKKRIMEIYLNIAQWGPDTFGIEAAAQAEFGISASDLSRRQAALLAVSLPNPDQRRASNPSGLMLKLAARVERLGRASGSYITCLYD
ncbi:biosynthetic peptidoglycan transglycosylase [Martelella mediterranea]|uniref:Biosynthetic peptidoglycan transglycosylase n=1 Tax=Martelella mediterranea TaxID=293089 RepID=A0A4V2V327_9HYPH|nr:transglycosylase domain-containing protein [Martelella mediterranea]TCT28457.1 monofunctional biosynthetic peptidoglycan transglycosylase [Martelella mediterranea]